jgi:hypothetical protein
LQSLLAVGLFLHFFTKHVDEKAVVAIEDGTVAGPMRTGRLAAF